MPADRREEIALTIDIAIRRTRNTIGAEHMRKKWMSVMPSQKLLMINSVMITLTLTTIFELVITRMTIRFVGFESLAPAVRKVYRKRGA